MNDNDVIQYLLNKPNPEVVNSTLAILSGFIDERSLADRIIINSALATAGVQISEAICRRDED